MDEMLAVKGQRRVTALVLSIASDLCYYVDMFSIQLVCRQVGCDTCVPRCCSMRSFCTCHYSCRELKSSFCRVVLVSAWVKDCCLMPLQLFADARKIATFIRANLWDEQRQRLLRSFLNGPSDVEGFADDYAFVISGLLELYSTSGETQWLAFAQQLQQKQDELFWDETGGRHWDDSIHNSSEEPLITNL